MSGFKTFDPDFGLLTADFTCHLPGCGGPEYGGWSSVSLERTEISSGSWLLTLAGGLLRNDGGRLSEYDGGLS